MPNKNKTIEKTRVITQDAFMRAVTDELIQKRQSEFVISSEAVDAHGTVFKLDGWNFDRFDQNPVVFYVHDKSNPNPDLLIGTGEVFREGDQIIGRVTYEPATLNPLAEKVFQKVQHGTLRMASVGFNPLEARFGTEEGEDPDVLYFTKQELREFSIVPIGSNPDALKRNQPAIDDIRSEIKAKNIEVTDPQVLESSSRQDKKMSVYEAQVLINKNKNS